MNTLLIMISAIRCMVGLGALADLPNPNYDENKVPQYQLPDPLTTSNGARVVDAKTWFEVRRPEIIELFEHQVYGAAPRQPGEVTFEVTEQHDHALMGLAIRKQVTVHFAARADGPSMDLLVYIPHQAEMPVPAFVGLNFYGNHSIHADPAIHLSTRWMRNNSEQGIVDHRATEASRGASATRWPMEDILMRGYALVTVYCGDLDPDFDDGFQNGVHPLAYSQGQTKPASDQWGTLSAWAWGLSRAMDYIETDPQIDHHRVAVMGHSRLGKTALWAGALDTRFALVISNNSGAGGAAISRRRFGETIQSINTRFPHWFCENFKKYGENEMTLPVDQHMLISLIAPRSVMVCSAEEDRWADPRGEFLACRAADPVFRLLGTQGLAVKEMPKPGSTVASRIGYRIRPGRHNVLPSDWQAFLDFADQHLSSRPK